MCSTRITISTADKSACGRRFGTSAGSRVRAELRPRRWFLDVVGKVALGVSHESARAWGATRIDDVLVANAGLYALASNSGRASRDAFAVVPEASVRLGYEFTDWLRAFVGY